MAGSRTRSAGSAALAGCGPDESGRLAASGLRFERRKLPVDEFQFRAELQPESFVSGGIELAGHARAVQHQGSSLVDSFPLYNGVIVRVAMVHGGAGACNLRFYVFTLPA